ncbi:hypothetical protein KP509_21G041000 [Ceratopteris richardii]|uniref:Uncharacterized protein n=1 Tax=Ceratopteris richardii TaxID=49495 RepID=A0A8T2SCJ3_CERRI|nr:hypothetical protein KP509_21G041000 [Ceratopteris richardii]
MRKLGGCRKKRRQQKRQDSSSRRWSGKSPIDTLRRKPSKRSFGGRKLSNGLSFRSITHQLPNPLWTKPNRTPDRSKCLGLVNPEVIHQKVVYGSLPSTTKSKIFGVPIPIVCSSLC